MDRVRLVTHIWVRSRLRWHLLSKPSLCGWLGFFRLPLELRWFRPRCYKSLEFPLFHCRTNVLTFQLHMDPGIRLAGNSSEALAADRIECAIRMPAMCKSSPKALILCLHNANVAEFARHRNKATREKIFNEWAVSSSYISRSLLRPTHHDVNFSLSPPRDSQVVHIYRRRTACSKTIQLEVSKQSRAPTQSKRRRNRYV